MQAPGQLAQTVDNNYIAQRIDGMRDNVERGESVLRAGIATGIFTPVVLQMIAVGEESGALDDMMEEVGQMYQAEVEYELKTLASRSSPSSSSARRAGPDPRLGVFRPCGISAGGIPEIGGR